MKKSVDMFLFKGQPFPEEGIHYVDISSGETLYATVDSEVLDVLHVRIVNPAGKDIEAILSPGQIEQQEYEELLAKAEISFGPFLITKTALEHSQTRQS